MLTPIVEKDNKEDIDYSIDCSLESIESTDSVDKLYSLASSS